MTKERLETLIEAAGIEQKDLADQLDLDESTISRYVGGSRSIPDEFAAKAEPYLIQKAEERVNKIRQVMKL